ncbi:hypothetical protein SIID45300_00801 [Candidatus Magnetaquicoccaceae bacterium FCR-1]|uniref:Uncharacterized protein n=1 Tax=Candidatus Magnetaquiglobus chichijimensis TaxID=3141448 RepID=A0ABQ0C6H6_9PROT
MSLNTDPLQATLTTLREAHAHMRRVVPESGDGVLKEVERIQSMVPILLRKVLRELVPGTPHLHEVSVKELLRLAFRHGLMSFDEVERWFTCRDQRNNTAHACGLAFTESTLAHLPICAGMACPAHPPAGDGGDVGQRDPATLALRPRHLERVLGIVAQVAPRAEVWGHGRNGWGVAISMAS